MGKKRKGERADGLIQISISIGYNADGKRVRKVFYGHTRAEAERKRDAYLMQQSPSNTYKANMTVSQWVDLYLKTYRTNVNPLYYQSAAAPYNRLKNDLGLRLLRSINEIDLQESLNNMAGMSVSYTTKYKQAIQQIFKKAAKNRLIQYDPSDDLQLPSCTRGTHKALTLQETQLITSHWHEAGASGLWMMIMLYAGLRRGEMMALDWSAIDMKKRTLTVMQVGVIQHNQIVVQKRTKSQAGLRTLPIPVPLYDALESVPTSQRTGFVCLSPNGHTLSETIIRRGLTHFIKVINSYTEPTHKLEFRMHDLRHTYCTLLYNAGVDVKTAAYLMGHSDIKVTMAIYTHLSAEQKAKSTTDLLTYFDNLSCNKKTLGSNLVVNSEANVENHQ